MAIWRSLPELCRAGAVFMALSVLLSSMGRVEAHDPLLRYIATLERHAALEVSAHDHSHDDGTEVGHHGGPAHKHGFTDHSHEATGALVNRFPLVPVATQAHRLAVTDFPLTRAPIRLDRPPKTILHV